LRKIAALVIDRDDKECKEPKDAGARDICWKRTVGNASSC